MLFLWLSSAWGFATKAFSNKKHASNKRMCLGSYRGWWRAASVEQQGLLELEPSRGREDGGWLGGEVFRPGEGQGVGSRIQDDCWVMAN